MSRFLFNYYDNKYFLNYADESFYITLYNITRFLLKRVEFGSRTNIFKNRISKISF